MSSKVSKYRQHIQALGLTDEQGQELIGAIECIIESLLDKKYMLGMPDETTTAKAD